HPTHSDELGVGHLGHDICQSCFAASGWTGNNQRRETVGFDCATQEFSRCQDVFLPDKFIECAWTHARREGSRCADPLQVFRLGFGEQIVHCMEMYGEGWLGASVNIPRLANLAGLCSCGVETFIFVVSSESRDVSYYSSAKNQRFLDCARNDNKGVDPR